MGELGGKVCNSTCPICARGNAQVHAHVPSCSKLRQAIFEITEQSKIQYSRQTWTRQTATYLDMWMGRTPDAARARAACHNQTMGKHACSNTMVDNTSLVRTARKQRQARIRPCPAVLEVEACQSRYHLPKHVMNPFEFGPLTSVTFSITFRSLAVFVRNRQTSRLNQRVKPTLKYLNQKGCSATCDVLHVAQGDMRQRLTLEYQKCST